MIYPLVSTDPNNYGTIETDITLQLCSERVNYYIDSLSTCCNFLVTTKSDYILIDDTKIMFEDKCEYDISALPKYLTRKFNSININVKMNDSNTLTLTGSKDFQIKDASHRVKMLIGLIDMELPLSSVDKTITFKTSPTSTFNNVLFIRSINGKEMITNDNENKHHPLILFRINSMLIPGLPLIIKNNHKKDSINVNYDAISHMKLDLVDYKLEPIILKSPLFITLVIEPVF